MPGDKMHSVKIFKAKLSNLRSMLEYIEVMAKTLGFSNKDFHKIQLASEEVLVNIISYAYPRKSSGSIEINCNIQNGYGITIKIKDQGAAFNPLKVKTIDTTLSAEKRPVGGLGIFFFLNVMDEFNYERSGNCNILTMTKFLKGI